MGKAGGVSGQGPGGRIGPKHTLGNKDVKTEGTKGFAGKKVTSRPARGIKGAFISFMKKLGFFKEGKVDIPSAPRGKEAAIKAFDKVHGEMVIESVEWDDVDEGTTDLSSRSAKHLKEDNSQGVVKKGKEKKELPRSGDLSIEWLDLGDEVSDDWTDLGDKGKTVGIGKSVESDQARARREAGEKLSGIEKEYFFISDSGKEAIGKYLESGHAETSFHDLESLATNNNALDSGEKQLRDFGGADVFQVVDLMVNNAVGLMVLESSLASMPGERGEVCRARLNDLKNQASKAIQLSKMGFSPEDAVATIEKQMANRVYVRKEVGGGTYKELTGLVMDKKALSSGERQLKDLAGINIFRVAELLASHPEELAELEGSIGKIKNEQHRGVCQARLEDLREQVVRATQLMDMGFSMADAASTVEKQMAARAGRS